MATAEHDTATQALPTPGAGPRLLHTPVHSIAPSLTNPRKTFDQAKLQELADSIKASGVHQPVLLRPLPAHRLEDTHREARANKRPAPEFELIAGERRWRASQLAGLAEIPAMVRPMTDTEALEAQVIENLQREDVTELEEAEGYEVLMRTGNLNADQVSAKIGKSRSYVYARLKVLDLCGEAREALRHGEIDFSKALLIARIPDEALQLKALDYCTDPNYYGDLPSQRDCARHIQQNFMLKLSSAKFKITDASLVPKAGSCKECPKRTGANPDLFQDVDSADVCTDPKCYHSKEEAHSLTIKKAALESGAHIIEGREAKALMPNSWSSEVKGYLRLDDKNDSPTDKPLRKLIGKAMEQQGIKPTLVANPHKDGELVAVITPDQAEVLLKAVNQEEAAAKIEQGAQLVADLDKRQAAAQAKTAFEEQWRWDLLTATWDQIRNGTHEAPSDAVMRGIATTMAKGLNQDRAKKLCKLLDLGKVAPVAGLLQYIADTDAPADALQLMVMFQDVEYRYWIATGEANTALLQVAEDFGVDLEKIKAQTKANQRTAAKAKADREAAKAAAPESASTPNPAAQAIPTRAGEKTKGAKGKTTPAAQARATAPKTTKAEATAQIAAALAEAEGDQDKAPAAHGNEGAPAPAGGVASDAAPSNSAAPVGPSVAWPFPNGWAEATATDSAAAPVGDAGAGAETGATVEGGDALVITSGMVLMVKDTCDAVSWRGRTVTVTGVKGNSIKAREANKPPAHAERGTFFAEDLEALK